MARVKLGALITDIRGKIGGQYFARGLGGLSLRNSPGTPVTYGKQVDQFITYSKIVANAWGELTEAQRTAWNVFAQMKEVPTQKGENIYLRGYGTFKQYNYHYYGAWSTILTTPSFVKRATLPVTCEVELSAPGDLDLNISRALDHTKEFLEVSLSTTRLTSRSIDFKALRHITYIITSVNTINLATEIEAVFGRLPAIGDTIYIAWKLLDKFGNFVETQKGIKTIVL